MKFFRLAARARYWKRRALEAEARVISVIENYEHEMAKVRSDAHAEMWRNREREDTFVSAAVMGGRGMWGVVPRKAPATAPEPQVIIQPPQTPDPYPLRGMQLLEFEGEWWPIAQQQGIPRNEAIRKFTEELARRNQTRLEDDPYSN